MALNAALQGMALKDAVEVISPWLTKELKTALETKTMAESACQEKFPKKSLIALGSMITACEGLRKRAHEFKAGVVATNVSDLRARNHASCLRLTHFMQGGSPRLVLIGGLAQASLFAGGFGNFGLEDLDESQKLQVYLSAGLKVMEMQGASEEDIERANTALGLAFKAESDLVLFGTIVNDLKRVIEERV